MYKTITLMHLSTIFIFTSSTHQTQTQTPLYTRRRILHQPFSFSPQITTTTTTPPTISPNPPPENQPNYPFSSLSPSTSTSNTDSPNTFFPLYTTPPPPPTTPTQPTTTPTFPANISSLVLTNTSHNSKPISKKLIAIAVSLSLLSAFLVAVVATLLIQHRRNLHSSVAKSDSLRLFPSNTAPSDAKPAGTLPVNEPASSSGGDDDNNIGASLYGYQKLGSPELRPLPPLPKQNPSGEQFYYNDSRKGKQEEFFSPTGSPNAGVLGSGGLDSGSRSFNSRTASYPSSQSHSPTQTMSTSPSIAFNSSPRSLTAKSPDSIVNFPAPLRPIPPPPSREPKDSLSPESTQDSPLRVSDVSEVNLPPMPPPMPRPRVLEMAPENGGLVIEHPVLVMSSRGPVDSENRGQVCESGEKNEEVLKLKLKPLHWDKVRASSDHAMVWDQLKSSSFQLNEEMIETLFMVNTSKVTTKDSSTPHPLFPLANQASQVLDPKKSQNIAILLRALNVTVGEVCEALTEGNGIAVYGCVAIPFK